MGVGDWKTAPKIGHFRAVTVRERVRESKPNPLAHKPPLRGIFERL